MFDRSKPKLGCSSSITNRWTGLSSFKVRTMMFKFVRCSIKWCSNPLLLVCHFKKVCISFSTIECWWKSHLWKMWKSFLEIISREKLCFKFWNICFFPLFSAGLHSFENSRIIYCYMSTQLVSVAMVWRQV